MNRPPKIQHTFLSYCWNKSFFHYFVWDPTHFYNITKGSVTHTHTHFSLFINQSNMLPDDHFMTITYRSMWFKKNQKLNILHKLWRYGRVMCRYPCKQRSYLIQADSTFRQIQTRFNMEIGTGASVPDFGTWSLRMYCIDRPGVPESRDACTFHGQETHVQMVFYMLIM